MVIVMIHHGLSPSDDGQEEPSYLTQITQCPPCLLIGYTIVAFSGAACTTIRGSSRGLSRTVHERKADARLARLDTPCASTDAETDVVVPIEMHTTRADRSRGGCLGVGFRGNAPACRPAARDFPCTHDVGTGPKSAARCRLHGLSLSPPYLEGLLRLLGQVFGTVD
ncbi:hypothetical protein CGRA01v4_11873 [Colletotrichum graminicola]|nr:hypothetical protein CGRA01v4_11873 [Colletotrichum graminicola]